MALFNVSVWQRSRFTLQCFIINLVGSLALLSAVALAQFETSEGVAGSVGIPDVALTCLGNLAVFMTAFTRGRLDMENGARDVLATTRGPKLNAINGCGLTTRPLNDLRRVDVVMLSKYNERPHSSLTQFMRYISHSHALESILLQFFPLTSPQVTADPQVTAERCNCGSGVDCHCVVFSATEDIMIMLAEGLPLTFKRLSENPSLRCLNNRCHGCNEGLLSTEELPGTAAGVSQCILRADNRTENSTAAAVCEALDEFLVEEENRCICIPVHTGNANRWTKFMIKFLKSKEKEAKGVRVVVSDALQHYITRSAQELEFYFRTETRCIFAAEIYERASLILPRVAEVIVNIGLVVWLRVDGFSSSLVARRAIRDHVVDSEGTGFSANAFLSIAAVFCSVDGTNVCQVLCFRGGILSARTVSYVVGFVNLICSITWSVLIAVEGYWAPAAPLSNPRVYVIIGFIGFAVVMDCFEVLGCQVCFQVWSRARAEVGVRAEAGAPAGAGAPVDVGAGAPAAVEAPAPAVVGAPVDVEAPAPAEAPDEVVVSPDEDEVGGLVEVVVSPDEDEVGGLVEVGVPVEAEAGARAEAGASNRFLFQIWNLFWRQARWTLHVVMIMMEVTVIASLVLWLLYRKKAPEGGVMHMKKGEERGVYGDLQSRRIYSGMQVLVWVKWGRGSFLLGDNATEDKVGSPYLFWTRKRGRWVYCSAFLLNAMLAGVRRKWKYSL